MSEIIKLDSKNIKEDMIRALSDSEIDGLVLVFRKNDQLGIMMSEKVGKEEDRATIMSVIIRMISFILNH